MPDKKLSRKDFLKISGAAATGLGLAGCELNSIPPEEEKQGLNLGPDPAPNDYAVYIGAGDTAVFNFIYILEQLQADFYKRITRYPYPGMSSEEERIFSDIHQHEVAHRDFYNDYLKDNSIQGLHFEFFATDFNDRKSVISSARLIEDVVVSMYNRIAELFENPEYVPLILKIVSVEARHAAAMRTLLKPQTSFFAGSDIITPNGLDAINIPSDVINILFPFVVENIDFRDFPKV